MLRAAFIWSTTRPTCLKLDPCKVRFLGYDVSRAQRMRDGRRRSQTALGKAHGELHSSDHGELVEVLWDTPGATRAVRFLAMLGVGANVFRLENVLRIILCAPFLFARSVGDILAAHSGILHPRNRSSGSFSARHNLHAGLRLSCCHAGSRSPEHLLSCVATEGFVLGLCALKQCRCSPRKTCFCLSLFKR